MDEYNSGMDPEVKVLFRKIINSLSFLVLWLMFVLGIGLFFDLGRISGKIEWFNIVFYLLSLTGFILLIRYLLKTWNRKDPAQFLHERKN
jgi:hypothetical protein